MDYNSNIDKETVVHSLTWKTLERVVSQGVSLVIQVVLARLLTPDDFGSLAIVTAITNYAAVFVQSGLATAIVQKDDLNDLDTSTLLTVSLGIASILYLFLFIFAPTISLYYHAPELIWVIRVLSLLLFLNAINSIQTAILSRRMEFKRLFLRSLIAIPVSGTVGIALAYMGFGVWALVIQQLTNVSVTVVVMFIGIDMDIKWGFSIERAIKIYSFSGKILISSLICGLYDMIRTMTIGRKYDASTLAYYDKANTYSYYVVQIINSSVTSVLLPVFSRKQRDQRKLKEMARKSVSLISFVMFPVLLGVAAVSKSFISVFLTEKWILCAPYLTVFCVLRLPGCIMSVDKQVYYAIGRSGIALAYETGLCIVNLFALAVTVRYAPLTVAVAAMIAEMAGCVAVFFISAKVYHYTLYERLQDMIRPAINSVMMFFPVWLIGQLNLKAVPMLFIQILLGMIVYIMLAKLTRDKNYDYALSLVKNFIKNAKKKYRRKL